MLIDLHSQESDKTEQNDAKSDLDLSLCWAQVTLMVWSYII